MSFVKYLDQRKRCQDIHLQIIPELISIDADNINIIFITSHINKNGIYT